MRTVRTAGAGAPGQPPPDAKAPGAVDSGDRAQDGEAREAGASVPPADAKRFASLQAIAAVNGWRLDRIGDRFLISRWRYCVELPDLDAVEAWLRRCGVST